MRLPEGNRLLKIMAAAREDSQHQALLTRCKELEEKYGEMMLHLPSEEREILDAYFLACCQMQLDLLDIAYECGRRSVLPLI